MPAGLLFAPRHGERPTFKVWFGARADIERILAIWHDCFKAYKGPYLFGKERCLADAMYAPVVTRFLTYDVRLDTDCAAYCARIVAMPEMVEWIEAAKREPDDLEELDVEFWAGDGSRGRPPHAI